MLRVTTLATHVAATDTFVRVVDPTGLLSGQLMQIDGENLRIAQGYPWLGGLLPLGPAIGDPTVVPVLRGQGGTRTAPHPLGATVVAGDPLVDFHLDRAGPTLEVSTPGVTPWAPPITIIKQSGRIPVPTTLGYHLMITAHPEAQHLVLPAPTPDITGAIVVLVNQGVAGDVTILDANGNIAWVEPLEAGIPLATPTQHVLMAIDWTWAPIGAANKSLADDVAQLQRDLAAIESPGLNLICQGRLSLDEFDAVDAGNTIDATTLYFLHYDGSSVALWDGTRWILRSFNDIAKALGDQLVAGLPYDVFVFDNEGTLDMEWEPWASATDRQTPGGLGAQDGIFCRYDDHTHRYVGTFVPTTATTTEDSEQNRLVYSYQNRVTKILRRTEPTEQWTVVGTGGVGVPQAANQNPANKVTWVQGIYEDAIDCSVSTYVNMPADSSGFHAYLGIGFDQVAFDVMNTAGAAVGMQSNPSPAAASLLTARWLAPGYGFHTLYWVEAVNGTGTATMTGSAGVVRSGLDGVIHC